MDFQSPNKSVLNLFNAIVAPQSRKMTGGVSGLVEFCVSVNFNAIFHHFTGSGSLNVVSRILKSAGRP